MIPVVPWYVTAIVLAINAGIAIAVWSILAAAAARSGLAPDAVRRFRIGAVLVLGAWLGAALVLAPPMASLATADPFRLNPLIPVFAGGSIAAALTALASSATLRGIVGSASVPAMVGVQVYRVIGFTFLVLLAAGQLPAHFAVPAGWGDIAVGLTAPLVALALARGTRAAPALAMTWAVLGLLDLVVAVGMGTGFLAPLLAPELGSRVAPAGPMGTFPLFIIPAFTVPLAVLLHLAVLGRLLRETPVSFPSVPYTMNARPPRRW